MAHENLGLRTWKRSYEAVPFTKEDEVIGVFDIAKENHGRLVRLGAETDDLNVHGRVLGANARARRW